MSVKGTWPRKDQTTREERDLRLAFMYTTMTMKEFDRRYKKLHKQGKITRNGKVVT